MELNTYRTWEGLAALTCASQSQDDGNGVGQLTAEERAQLIAHLKVKWSSVNTAYQKMTFTLDTPTKQKRKETYLSLIHI